MIPWRALGILGLALIVAGCATGAKKKEETPAPVATGPQAALLKKAQDAREAVDKDPTSAENQYKLGNALFDTGQYAEARAAYSEAVRLKSDYAAAYCNLGLTLKRLGKTEDAVKAYRTALNIEPDDKVTLLNLASTLENMGDHDGQIALLNHLAKVYPDDSKAQVELAHTLFKLNRYEEAATAFKEVLRLEAADEGDYYNLGLCYFNRENWDETVTTWLAGLARSPKDPSLLKGLAVVYWKRKDFEQSWQYVQKCQALGVTLSPDFIRSLQDDSGQLGPGEKKTQKVQKGRLHTVTPEEVGAAK